MPQDAQGNWVSKGFGGFKPRSRRSKVDRAVTAVKPVESGKQAAAFKPRAGVISAGVQFNNLKFNRLDLDAPFDLKWVCCGNGDEVVARGLVLRDVVELIAAGQDGPKNVSLIYNSSKVDRKAKTFKGWGRKVIEQNGSRLVEEGVIPVNPFKRYWLNVIAADDPRLISWFKQIGFIEEVTPVQPPARPVAAPVEAGAAPAGKVEAVEEFKYLTVKETLKKVGEDKGLARLYYDKELERDPLPYKTVLKKLEKLL